jgi:hypothetical protein
MMSPMRITNLFRKAPTAPEGCQGTLVLHADGTAECEHESACGLDDLQHELWVACDELGCGCVGDDAPLEGWALPLAA